MIDVGNATYVPDGCNDGVKVADVTETMAALTVSMDLDGIVWLEVKNGAFGGFRSELLFVDDESADMAGLTLAVLERAVPFIDAALGPVFVPETPVTGFR